MNGRSTVRHGVLLALIPALAFAGPRKGKKPPKKAATHQAGRAAGGADTSARRSGRAGEGREARARHRLPASAHRRRRAAAAAPEPTAGTGAGGGTGDTPADEAAEPAGASDADVDTLRQEYLSLRDELFKSRARANAVASQLYSTRIQIKLTYTTARYYNPAKASIRLDGANVYEDASGAIAGDDASGSMATSRPAATWSRSTSRPPARTTTRSRRRPRPRSS